MEEFGFGYQDFVVFKVLLREISMFCNRRVVFMNLVLIGVFVICNLEFQEMKGDRWRLYRFVLIFGFEEDESLERIRI